MSANRNTTATSTPATGKSKKVAASVTSRSADVTAPVEPKPAASKPVASKHVVPKPAATKTPFATPVDKSGKGKAKLVRDSFTMPQADFGLIAILKARAIGLARPTKKSELLCAGLQALAALDDARLQAALGSLISLKPGRPKKV